MKQTIHIRIMKMLSCIAVFSAIVGTCMLAGCNPTKEKTGADLVVYGKIFTSENNQVAESFAVKNGKYVYVGDRKEAEAFVEMGKTEVLDYTGKGLVMPVAVTVMPIMRQVLPSSQSEPWSVVMMM